jgi:hypothetical protein
MELDELLDRLRPWFDRHRRPAWRPITESGESPIARSKFSGTPWVPESGEWPRCRHCGEPIALFLQLDLDELPDEVGRPFGSGLLQFFYCTNMESECEQHCEGWSHFSNAHLIRIIRPDGPPRTDLEPLFESSIPARTIVGWESFDDDPCAEEFEELGLALRPEGFTGSVFEHLGVECPEVGLAESGLPGSYRDDPRFDRCSSGDKLAGWPSWVQGVEYPDCPECGRQMRLVFQLDSNQNLDFMFGDVGCGHITQCPSHPDVLAFGWACG